MENENQTAYVMVHLDVQTFGSVRKDQEETSRHYPGETVHHVTKKYWREANNKATCVINACRRVIEFWSVDTGIDGMRCIEASAYDSFRTSIDPMLEQARKKLNEIFVENYEENMAKDRSATAKGATFRERDYPSLEEVKTRLNLELVSLPMSEVRAQQLSALSEKNRQDLRREHQTRMESFRISQARHAFQTLREQLSKITGIDKKDAKSRVKKLEVLEDICVNVIGPNFNVAQNKDFKDFLTNLRTTLLVNKELVHADKDDQRNRASLASEFMTQLDELERKLI